MAYDALVEIASPSRVQRAAFADKMKMCACAALGIPFVDTADAVNICNMLKENSLIEIYKVDEDGYEYLHGLSGREYLQFTGTEAHRDIFGSDFWIDALLPRPVGDKSDPKKMWTEEDSRRAQQIVVANRFPEADVVVITDVRFPNEAERILALGGEVWYIDAEKRLGPLPEDAHVSEHRLPEACVTRDVDNNYDLAHFRRRLEVAYHG